VVGGKGIYFLEHFAVFCGPLLVFLQMLGYGFKLFKSASPQNVHTLWRTPISI
jgi:hypothetical protein